MYHIDYYKRNIERIQERYNPEHDINTCENAPPVTWNEMELANFTLKLFERVQELEERIKALENCVDPEDLFYASARNRKE